MQPALDLDNPGTWPSAIQSFANLWATRLDGRTRWASDLKLPIDAQDSFMGLIGEWPLRAYHSTRLLDEEAAAIRRQGLIPLSEELVTSRISNACATGHLTPGERDTLLAENVFTSGNTSGRLDQVCAVVGRTIFDDNPGAVDLLLRLWGGEAIYWPHERAKLAGKLRTLGRPSIVVIRLCTGGCGRSPFFVPPLAQLFVGRLLQLPETYGDVHYYSPIRPEDIVGIWQPGSDEYDRHRNLPRA